MLLREFRLIGQEMWGKGTGNEKVLVLSSDPWLDRLYGGCVLRLFKDLARLEYEVKISLPSSNSKIIDDGFLLVKGLEVKTYRPLFTLVTLVRQNWRLVLEEKPRVLVFDHLMLPLFFLTKVLLKTKGIMLILSRPIEKGFLPAVLFRLSLAFGKLLADVLTATSPFERFEFSRLGKIPEDKITVVPCILGGQFERFSSPMDVDQLRLKLGLGMLLGKKVILYHGALDDQRGVLKLLDFFTKSFQEDQKITLLIVGKGSAEDSVRGFITKNRLKNVILWGPVSYSKIPEVILASDVGLVVFPDLPCWRYQSPIKLIEFLALNKPVLASDLPGIRWIAANSPLVVYLKEFGLYDFKEGMKEVLKKADASKQNMEVTQDFPSAYGRLSIINRFSSRAIALKLSQVIANLVT